MRSLDSLRKVAGWIVAQPEERWNNDWGETLQLYGLLYAGRVFGESAYVEYVKSWLWRRIERGINILSPESPIDWEQYRTSRRLEVNGYCGSWGCNFIIPVLDPKDRYLTAIARLISEYIVTRAERTAEGGLRHGGGNTLYFVDTLFYAVPGLAMMSEVTGDIVYAEEGLRQLKIHARRLLDEGSGLFYHGWRDVDGWRSAELWARGNGWALMSAVEWLAYAPLGPEQRAWVIHVVKRMAEALYPLQTERGRWRTVLNRPEAYEEVSASAMFAFGLARGVRLGVLDERARRAVELCLHALEEAVAEDGAVTGVSAGTGPRDLAHYLSRPTGTYPWGTGAWLLAVSEAALMDQPIARGLGSTDEGSQQGGRR